MRLKNKIAIITGGSRGIGRATAIAFGREGAKVIVVAREIKTLEEVVNIIRENGGESIAIKTDVGDPNQVFNMVQKVIKFYGRIDILVNNAGITRDAFIEKMAHQQWADVVNINLNGTFYCIKETVPYMINNKYGRIINTASVAGEKGAIAQANYAATKAGIIGLTKSLAQELGPKGITVNAVSPGLIYTDMVKKIPDKIKEKALKSIALGRIGVSEEIANSYIFLASDEATYCNGTILDVNGGISV